MGADGQLGRGICPRCGTETIQPHLDAHPVAAQLRTGAYYLAGIGFFLAGAFFLLPALKHEDMSAGLKLGFKLFSFALFPAFLVLIMSLCYRKVWYITCGGCRQIFYREKPGAAWKAAPQSKRAKKKMGLR